VGMWQFTFVSRNSPPIPNGIVLDAGFSQWHSDGTEITNSSRPPGNGQFIGPASIQLEVTVDRSGDTYSGTFTIDQYDNANHLLADIAGDVTAQRVTVD
jgi:hypothetical protein